MVLTALGAGCAPALEDEIDNRAQASESSSLSYVGAAIVSRLSGDDDASLRYRTWNVSSNNHLEGDWILETPLFDHWQSTSTLPVAERCDSGAGCDTNFRLRRCETQADCTGGGICRALEATVAHPGQAATRLCLGHSDTEVDEFYRLVTSAESTVDISSLTPADGRFEAALRNAVTYLSHTGRSVRIRLAYGTFPGSGVDVGAFRDSLVRDVAAGADIELWVGAYRYGFTSWNHAKIVAVDGESAIVGGMNLWDQHYLANDPVFDLSMRVRGQAAADAHGFTNELWDYLCHGWSWFGTKAVARFPASAAACPPPSDPSPGGSDGELTVITVGRLGSIGANVSDDALLALLGSARENIYLSLQDLGPVRQGWLALGSWPESILHELALALARGVDVYVVLSNLGSQPGGLGSASAGYSNGWTPEQTAREIANRARDLASAFPAGADVDAELCAHLHVAPLRPGAASTWPSGASFANHAKTVMVDDRAFYIGSQNLYPANLAEMGFIVDDVAAAAELVDTYWWPIWSTSSAAAVSGAEAGECAID